MWTQESFLIRSRDRKMSYKDIAHSLDKSPLACRLHYHHMTVGRKVHRVGDVDDGRSESSASVSPPVVPVERFFQSYPGAHLGMHTESSSSKLSTSQPCTLPSFDVFMRSTFPADPTHKRSFSMPLPRSGSPLGRRKGQDTYADAPSSGSRLSRTLSGTLIKPPGDLSATSASLSTSPEQCIRSHHRVIIADLERMTGPSTRIYQEDSFQYLSREEHHPSRWFGSEPLHQPSHH